MVISQFFLAKPSRILLASKMDLLVF